jgi:streptomycin 6-kinase
MIRNPHQKLASIEDLAPLLRNRIDILSQELEIDNNRLLGWCIAQSVLSAVWNIESHKGPEHALRVANTLIKLQG